MKNVACHPSLSTIFPPTATPITVPAAYIEVNIAIARGSLSSGNLFLIILNEIGITANPIPCIDRATSMIGRLLAKPPSAIPTEYIMTEINSNFFLPYTSDNFPRIGAVTAAVTR